MTIYQPVQLSNGDVLSGDIISKLVKSIINQFADEKLSVAAGKIILGITTDEIDGYSRIQKN